MAHIIADRVKETSTTTGTGALTLAGAVTDFRAFSAVCANNDTAYYTIEMAGGGGWEVGLGTWGTGNILTRTTVLASSNAGAAVNFGAGTKNVFLTHPASVLPNLSASGRLVAEAADAAAQRTALGLGTAAVKNTGTSGNNVPVLDAANTWSGSQKFIQVAIDGAAGTDRPLIFSSGGLSRWKFSANTAAESGGDAGSLLVLTSYDDAGVGKEFPLSANRVTGAITLKSLLLTNDLAVADGGTGASTALAARANLGLDQAPITYVIDGGGSVITTGIKGDLEIPFACTINRVTVLADVSGSIVVDIWKDSYANYPPVDADSITASAPPTITTATKSQDSTLTGWTTSVAAGDILRFNVDSVTTITRVTVSLRVTR